MRIIKREGQVKVIEFEEGKEVIRRVLPTESDNADLGAPYGIPFAIVLNEHGVCDAMAKKIEQELHKRNVWTALDLQNNHNAALSAIQAAYGIDLQTLMKIAKANRRQQ